MAAPPEAEFQPEAGQKQEQQEEEDQQGGAAAAVAVLAAAGAEGADVPPPPPPEAVGGPADQVAAALRKLAGHMGQPKKFVRASGLLRELMAQVLERDGMWWGLLFAGKTLLLLPVSAACTAYLRTRCPPPPPPSPPLHGRLCAVEPAPLPRAAAVCRAQGCHARPCGRSGPAAGAVSERGGGGL